MKVRILASLAASALALNLSGLGAATSRHDAPPPALDPKRVINESLAFLKEREPDMTETEYALYEKVVPMIAAQPQFALTLLEGMVAQQESSPAFEFILGNVYLEQKRYPEAEARFRTAIAKFPTFVRAWDNLGVLHFTTERYAEAVPCFTRVLALGESEPRVFGLLAYCLLKTGNPLAAEAAYLQAYSRDPDNGDWIEGLLSTYLDSRQFPRAEALLRQLVRNRPDDPRFWQLLASVTATQGRRIEAIAELESARSLGVLDLEGLLMLADLLVAEKLFAEGIRAYQEASVRAPDIGVPRMLHFAQALAAEERYDEAGRVLDAVDTLASPPDQIRALQTRADIAIARETWTTARAPLETILARDPLNGRALLALGLVEEASGQDARAQLMYESAARQDDQVYDANLRLANLHVRLQRYDDALAAVEKALAQDRSTQLLDFQARIRALAQGSD